MNKNKKTYFYPLLGGKKDFWIFRLAGDGIGNGLYSYFHAYVLALKNEGVMVAPPWPTLKIGPLLRGENSKRLYWGMFSPVKEDLFGIKKILKLIKLWLGRNEIVIAEDCVVKVEKNRLNVVSVPSSFFTFDGLFEYREQIKSRFLEITKKQRSDALSWGNGGFIGVHVRLGDFKAIEDTSLLKKGTPNARIPIKWYIDVIKGLKKRYPEMPVMIFSDGADRDLVPFTEIGAEKYHGQTDVDDLFMLSRSSILVGSRSTFSYWAAFFGNMPSLWLKTESNVINRRFSSKGQTKQLFIPLDDVPELIDFDL